MADKFFESLESKLPKNNNNSVVVVMAENEAVAFAVKEALNKGFLKKATLVGNSDEIKKIEPIILMTK